MRQSTRPPSRRRSPSPAPAAKKASFSKRARALADQVAPSDVDEQSMVGKRALKTRDRIIDTAVQLFLERGYGGTTIDNIADAAGMSRASFYSYFPSKRELLILAGLRSRQASEARRLLAISKIPDDWTLDHLKNWIRSYFSYLDEHGGFLVAWSQAAYADDELRTLGIKGSMHSARVVGAEMQRLGAGGRVDPRIQGLAVMAMIDRFWYVWRKSGAPFDDEQVVDGLARMVQSLLR